MMKNLITYWTELSAKNDANRIVNNWILHINEEIATIQWVTNLFLCWSISINKNDYMWTKHLANGISFDFKLHILHVQENILQNWDLQMKHTWFWTDWKSFFNASECPDNKISYGTCLKCSTRNWYLSIKRHVLKS